MWKVRHHRGPKRHRGHHRPVPACRLLPRWGRPCPTFLTAYSPGAGLNIPKDTGFSLLVSPPRLTPGSPPQRNEWRSCSPIRNTKGLTKIAQSAAPSANIAPLHFRPELGRRTGGQ